MTNTTTELRHYDVQLPGYADGEETNDELSIWIAAPDEAVAMTFLPAGCELQLLAQAPEPMDVAFTLPRDGEALRAEAMRIIVQDVPRDDVAEALENITATLENVLLHLGDRMTDADRRARTRLVDESKAALANHLHAIASKISPVDERTELLAGPFEDDPAAAAKAFTAVLPLLQRNSPLSDADIEWRERERVLKRLLSTFEIEEAINPLQPPATYLEEVRLSCEFQPGQGRAVADAIRKALGIRTI